MQHDTARRRSRAETKGGEPLPAIARGSCWIEGSTTVLNSMRPELCPLSAAFPTRRALADRLSDLGGHRIRSPCSDKDIRPAQSSFQSKAAKYNDSTVSDQCFNMRLFTYVGSSAS